MKTPYFVTISLSAIFLSIVLLAPGCKKSSTAAAAADVVTLPLVTTNSVIINLTSTTAQSGGVITSTGGGTITANGVCYSATNKTPTTTDTKTTDAIGSGSTSNQAFTSNLAGLTANTTYYLRAYTVNSAGTAYGSVTQFTTPSNLGSVIATVTTFAGNGLAGYVDASGLNAQFSNPQGLTADKNGNVYVSDSFNDLIREITPAGAVTTVAGTQGIGYVDGPAATAQFYAPNGSVFDAQGNLYVTDLGNNVIRKITPAGLVSTFAGNGTAGYIDGAATAAEFNNPHALAIDGSGNIYVADRGNNIIRKITSAGVVSTFAGTRTAGYVDATGTGASFNNPTGLVADAGGNVYVADQGNSAIRKITPAGVVTTIVGGATQSTLVNLPSGIAIDKQGNLYIVDEGGRVLKFTTGNVLYILAGTFNVSGFVNGSGAAALFNNPQGITVDDNGNIYVADQYNDCIRKITVAVTP
jgi:sugar lactone lactonase YvrE